MGNYSIRDLERIQHKLLNPLSEKYKYIIWVEKNPFSVCNGEKRRQCAYLEHAVLKIQSLTKKELIGMLKLWISPRFAEYNSNKDTRARWLVISVIKKALSYSVHPIK